MSEFRILEGDCLARLADIPDRSVQTCVTSPPYWGLRDYGAEGQLGLEPTPEHYVENMVAVFREVRRVLRDDGTLWLNLGDSYAHSTDSLPPHRGERSSRNQGGMGGGTRRGHGCKPKDLVGIPWMVAFALRADGWVLRQEIVWQKPNPMPESVTDRCTNAHEQIFMFSKAKWRGPEPGRFAHISEEDARWLALFVDTEGNITVKKTRDCLGIQIAVAGCHRGLLERAQAIVGAGNILERKGTNAPVFYWQVSNKAARDLLLRLYPHLIVKQRQARIGIYIESLVGREGQPRSPKRTELLNRLWEANKSCNSFGDPDLSWVPEPKIGGWGAGPRYFYDADAIREDGAGRLDLGTMKFGGRINGDTGWHNDGLERDEPGRNKRSVWHVATQPFPGAHFATFPPKLIEPCILAGSPPKCCGECGAPWERVVVATAPDGRSAEVRGGKAYDEDGTPLMGDNMIDHGVRGSWNSGGATLTRETAGWRSTCDHDDDTGTATVLDPFAGSGTTGVVALRHNRDFIGCELNPEYAQMARHRITDDAPLLNVETA